MNSQILLNELVKKELITQQKASEVQKDVEISHRHVEDVLNEKRLVPDVEVAKVKSALLKVPYKKVNVEELNEEILNLIPQETVQSYKAVPLGKQGSMLIVGMLYPDDEKAQESLTFIARRNKMDLGAYLISRGDYDAVLRKYNPYANEISAALRFLKPNQSSSETAQKVVKLDEGGRSADDAPIIKIVSSTLSEAVTRKASDIHIEPQKNRLRIRFRLDGELEEIMSLPIELHLPIISRIKILSDLLIDENRKPQDGRFRTIIFGQDIDFRVATFPTPVGEKVALRVLDPSIGLKGLNDLGIVGANQELLEEGVAKPFGMVLITGPTGSGKTTTLYALLQILNEINVNILSLEDPVEYFVEGLNQSQVKPEIGYDFASGLREILRQDPDIIMIGEIRDKETAELSVHAALTGHVVLSTLHTNNAVGVIPRLIDMGVDAYLLPSALNIMAGQRLVLRLCDDCKEAQEPAPDVLETIKKELGNISPRLKKDIKEPYRVYRSHGCKTCKGKGYVGRTAIFEVFKMTRELADIISGGTMKESAILGEAKRQGMLTLREDGILKALRGLITIEDVLRETEEL